MEYHGSTCITHCHTTRFRQVGLLAVLPEVSAKILAMEPRPQVAHVLGALALQFVSMNHVNHASSTQHSLALTSKP